MRLGLQLGSVTNALLGKSSGGIKKQRSECCPERNLWRSLPPPFKRRPSDSLATCRFNFIMLTFAAYHVIGSPTTSKAMLEHCRKLQANSRSSFSDRRWGRGWEWWQHAYTLLTCENSSKTYSLLFVSSVVSAFYGSFSHTQVPAYRQEIRVRLLHRMYMWHIILQQNGMISEGRWSLANF